MRERAIGRWARAGTARAHFSIYSLRSLFRSPFLLLLFESFLIGAPPAAFHMNRSPPHQRFPRFWNERNGFYSLGLRHVSLCDNFVSRRQSSTGYASGEGQCRKQTPSCLAFFPSCLSCAACWVSLGSASPSPLLRQQQGELVFSFVQTAQLSPVLLLAVGHNIPCFSFVSSSLLSAFLNSTTCAFIFISSFDLAVVVRGVLLPCSLFCTLF